ncbi:uncharacterized protein LOC124872670 isoform X5 [Girardinichthys multiradiatus]|uniref:uncharacterized protein LOC124872670 isoform X5 n=1 Tax=Girardinichthys multiradiatus TaxID=208333 RepID=UPI001FABF366|nr:uncharacterized protein LOC124872670 isoform X5 [Girardinichthys multiradiatus]
MSSLGEHQRTALTKNGQAQAVFKWVLSREEDEDQGIKTMKRTHLEAVEKPLFYIATLLDPRYKDGFFTKSANLSLAKEHLIQEVAIRAASAMPEEQGLQQSQRTRHDGVKHAAAWTAPLRKSEKRGSHRPGP